MTTPLNNTYKHISDEAQYVAFDPTGSSFPSTVTDVQSALALTSPTQYATEALPGVVAIATTDEVLAGIDTKKAVTPFTLAARLQYPDATTTQKGVLSLATNTEAQTGTNASKGIVPSSLKYTLDWWWTNKVSSETAAGVLKLSTLAAATAGVDDTTAMTPLKVKQAIAAATSNLPVPTAATETIQGQVTLATVGQVQAGTLREGYAVSPYTLANLKGSLTSRGIVQAATLAQANLGTDDSLYVSAKGFKTYTATTTNVGTVKLTDTPGTAGPGIALSSTAKVLSTVGTTQTVAGTVNFTGTLQYKGSPVSSEAYVDSSMPIGSVIMWLSDTLPPGGKWAKCDGGQESTTTRAALFAVLGYKFGGAGTVFYRPDMRGLFVRGTGIGKDILADRGLDEFGKPKLGEGVYGAAVGEIQKQQVIKHKHASIFGYQNRHLMLDRFGASKLAQYFGWTSNSKSYARRNDCYTGFTNDGTEFEPSSVRDDGATINSTDLIGTENRPWNMSVNYIIRVA